MSLNARRIGSLGHSPRARSPRGIGLGMMRRTGICRVSRQLRSSPPLQWWEDMAALAISTAPSRQSADVIRRCLGCCLRIGPPVLPLTRRPFPLEYRAKGSVLELSRAAQARPASWRPSRWSRGCPGCQAPAPALESGSGTLARVPRWAPCLAGRGGAKLEPSVLQNVRDPFRTQ